MTLTANVEWNELSSRVWDVVVVGAGPAGSVAARQIARLGRTVLLVDKSAFPRWKVCGCCVNGCALATLAAMGLGHRINLLGGVPLVRAVVAFAERKASIGLNHSRAMSRTTFDAALVEAGIEAGVRFLPETMASLRTLPIGERHLCLRQAHREAVVATRVVLAADGLGGRLLAGEPGFQVITGANSRIGAGTTAKDAPEFYAPGMVFLAGGAGGYVGLVRLEDGPLHVAAALDRKQTRNLGGPGAAVEAMVMKAGWPAVPGLAGLPWRGTPPLTRRALKPAGERVFVIGDAAGYVEPFTGEGIAWALASAMAVAPLAAEASRNWRPALAECWARRHRRLLGPRRRLCRAITLGLRRPSLVRISLALLSVWPSLANPLVRGLDAPFHVATGSSS
jgi:flavin-dependent dehydrogenase